MRIKAGIDHEVNCMNVYKIEYEIPPLRAIYHCECDAYDEQGARLLFSSGIPLGHIRKIQIDPDSKPSPPQPAPPATDEKEGEGEKVNINADGK